jgi:2-iminobutanoate/2-iminopropanoate deaminase
MNKEIIVTPDAPAPIGPYSQAVSIGNFLFISGQIPIQQSTGKLITENIQSEAKQVMENLKAILTAANLDFNDVVKTSIFLTDMNQFSEVNAVYATYFTNEFPARETVAAAALPRGVHIEISMIAVNKMVERFLNK